MARDRDRRARLRAGIRCHGRFYEALACDVRAALGARRPRQRLARLLGEFGAPEVFKRVVGVSVSFEVNLRSRRPDCVCLLRLAEAGRTRAVCLIVELKTCRFSANMNTPSKVDQRLGGLRQLRDSARLVRDLAPPGPDPVVLAPVLVFIAQRGMRVLRVTRLPAQTIASSAARLEAIIAGLAEHVPFARTRARRAGRSPRGRRREAGRLHPREGRSQEEQPQPPEGRPQPLPPTAGGGAAGAPARQPARRPAAAEGPGGGGEGGAGGAACLGEISALFGGAPAPWRSGA
ncbi:nuclear protein UL24 [Cervid alphaherpesvirus 1]|uniref:Protein UL24 homolog n=1 Tax=Cervid alphaherpesvirus 1 TaxID=79891 RepID=A0A455JMZ4_9ALPH|nr:nuclear protein UL24 [Cervid alphaherpesvirus 1]AVT50686.1 nuclear protein UL24 [Cervid alphaherpesvirus 1]